MIRFARDFRLIPVVLLATICLFALKVSGLVFDGGYTLAERLQGQNKTDMTITTAESVPDYPKITIASQTLPGTLAASTAKRPWAQEMFNYGTAAGDVTGSVGEGAEKKDDKPGETLKIDTKPPEPTKLQVGDTPIKMQTDGKIASAGENAILERLHERSKELDDRTREMEMRDSLIKAAEKRLEAKVAELKDQEARVTAAIDNRGKAEAERFKGLVSMYENMKSKDAARIFDRLELKILVDVSTQMNPRKMSEILGLMSPEAAERLTVELANRASAQKPQNPDQLPKIDGKPAGT